MKVNFFKNKLFLSIFILFFYNKYTFSNHISIQKENFCFNCKKILYIKNSLKKKYKKRMFFIFKDK